MTRVEGNLRQLFRIADTIDYWSQHEEKIAEADSRSGLSTESDLNSLGKSVKRFCILNNIIEKRLLLNSHMKGDQPNGIYSLLGQFKSGPD